MIIIKIGGGAAINHAAIVADLAQLDTPFIIVHGANARRDQLAEALGKQRTVLTSVSGVSSVYSDADALDLLMMAYAGLANKRLVELCQKHGVNAIGLSGLDGRMIAGRRNAGIRVREGEKVRMVHDLSGKPVSINQPLLDMLLNNGYRPVLCVPIIAEDGTAINSENDDIVQVLQESTRAEWVIHLLEAPGLLNDPEDPASLIRHLTREELTHRVECSQGRIKRKLMSIARLVQSGSSRVVIADGRVENPIQRALAGEGTTII